MLKKHGPELRELEQPQQTNKERKKIHSRWRERYIAYRDRNLHRDALALEGDLLTLEAEGYASLDQGTASRLVPHPLRRTFRAIVRKYRFR